MTDLCLQTGCTLYFAVMEMPKPALYSLVMLLGCHYLRWCTGVIAFIHSHFIHGSISVPPHLPDALQLLPPVLWLPCGARGLRPGFSFISNRDPPCPPAVPRGCTGDQAPCKREMFMPEANTCCQISSPALHPVF